jgi:small-conductance mechanosensitive channel
MIHNFLSYLPNFEKFDPKMLLTSLAIFVIGLMVASLLSAFVFKVIFRNFLSPHHAMLLRKMVFYFTTLVFAFFAIDKLGFDLKGVAGALGIGTLAFAWAANTAVTNVASGIFLLGEKPFEIGDYVRIEGPNGWDGQILSIDLLSVKMRTRDNTLVRMPNELLLKSEVRNLTRFPIRRVDIKFRVAFSENLTQIKRILFESAQKNPLCLESPVPELFFTEFGEAGILLQFSAWSKRSSFINLQTSLQTEIQERFREAGIQLPMTYFQFQGKTQQNSLTDTTA